MLNYDSTKLIKDYFHILYIEDEDNSLNAVEQLFNREIKDKIIEMLKKRRHYMRNQSSDFCDNVDVLHCPKSTLLTLQSNLSEQLRQQFEALEEKLDDKLSSCIVAHAQSSNDKSKNRLHSSSLLQIT